LQIYFHNTVIPASFMSIIIFTSLDYFMEVCEIEIALKIFPLRAYFLQISAIHEISRIAEILPNAEI